MPDLEPCPHCGGEPTTEISAAYFVDFKIRCLKCGASVAEKCKDKLTFSDAPNAMLKAVRKWNARTNKNEKKESEKQKQGGSEY